MKKILMFMMLIMVLSSCSKVLEDEMLILMMKEQIIVPQRVYDDIKLLDALVYSNKDYSIFWSSTHQNIIDVNGHVTQTHEDTLVQLEATVHTEYQSKSIIFEVIVMKKEINPWTKHHQYVLYAKDMSPSKLSYLNLENGKLELLDGYFEGSYESDVIDAKTFSKMIGSWAATSSTHATIELQVRVNVDGMWSKYLSYQSWGFGKNNFSMNSGDQIAKISIDEIVILNDKKANKFQYKILLKRSKTEIPSPKLDLVSFALTIPDYHYRPNIDQLPNHVDYDVPLLNQQSVPDIGNHICSPTSAAMLLLYKGHDLYLEDELPQRYIAQRFRDYGANIYGNWVFNTVGMSSYHEKAYVGMMYSFEELMMHLANVGPVAASVSGDMGLYHTSGHLIVVRGYRITDRGDIYVLVNDPNINARFGDDKNGDPLYVYYEFPLETFMKTWKGIVYIIE